MYKVLEIWEFKQHVCSHKLCRLAIAFMIPLFSPVFHNHVRRIGIQITRRTRGYGDSLNQNWRGDPECHWPLDAASLLQEGEEKPDVFSPLLFFPSCTMLNSVWPTTTPCTTLNFCSAAESAPFFSWTLYLRFLSVQFSKHIWSTYCIWGMMGSTGSLTYQYVLCFYNIEHMLYITYTCIYVYFYKQSKVAFNKRVRFESKYLVKTK